MARGVRNRVLELSSKTSLNSFLKSMTAVSSLMSGVSSWTSCNIRNDIGCPSKISSRLLFFMPLFSTVFLFFFTACPRSAPAKIRTPSTVGCFIATFKSHGSSSSPYFLKFARDELLSDFPENATLESSSESDREISSRPAAAAATGAAGSATSNSASPLLLAFSSAIISSTSRNRSGNTPFNVRWSICSIAEIESLIICSWIPRHSDCIVLLRETPLVSKLASLLAIGDDALLLWMT